MSEEPRTEILRRRIELYLHCIGMSAADPAEFVQQIAAALMITTESTLRDDDATHRSR
jgi:hypothetical protein